MANAWEGVSGGAYDAVAAECVALKKALGLNDWGYYDLVRTLADGFCGPKTNESVVLQSFLMAEAGYKVRMARGGRPAVPVAGHRRAGLCPSLFQYRRPGILYPGRCPAGRVVQYLQFHDPRGAAFVAGDARAAPLRAEPRGARRPQFRRRGFDDGDGKPQPDGFLYELSALSLERLCGHGAYCPGVRATLSPAARRSGPGRASARRRNCCCTTCTGLSPTRPTKHRFGIERTLFAEEMYYYPYSDCEDRSILFARLVKDLLGLMVVLLYYPGGISPRRYASKAR